MAKSKSDPTDLSSLLASRKKQKSENKKPNNTVDSEDKKEAVAKEEKKKVGRPPGRRSDPNCSPLNLILNEDTINEAKYKLAKLNKGKTPKKSLSDLVEELLDRWIEDH